MPCTVMKKKTSAGCRWRGCGSAALLRTARERHRSRTSYVPTRRAAQINDDSTVSVGDGVDDIPMTRIATVLMQIARVIYSFVPAGNFEITTSEYPNAGTACIVDKHAGTPVHLMCDLAAANSSFFAYVELVPVCVHRVHHGDRQAARAERTGLGGRVF